MPHSSQSSLNLTSAAMSPMPQLEPQRAMVSYSGPSPMTVLPSSSTLWTLRQAMAHW